MWVDLGFVAVAVLLIVVFAEETRYDSSLGSSSGPGHTAQTSRLVGRIQDLTGITGYRRRSKVLKQSAYELVYLISRPHFLIVCSKFQTRLLFSIVFIYLAPENH